jgi:hypothetical protein
MTTSVFTPRELFAEFPEHSFDSYAKFEETLVTQFNQHMFGFPPGYRWRDALEWGVRREIVRREGRQIIVSAQRVEG